MCFLIIIFTFHSSFAAITDIILHNGMISRTEAQTNCSHYNMWLPGYLGMDDRKHLRRYLKNSSVNHAWLAVKRHSLGRWKPIVSIGVNWANESCVLGQDKQLELKKDPSKRCLKIDKSTVKRASCYVKVPGFLCFVRGSYCKVCHYWNCLSLRTGSCLKVGLHELTWSQAETECQEKGGHLWIKTNGTSDEKVVAQLKEHGHFNNKEYWIGWRAEEWRSMNQTAGTKNFSEVLIKPETSGKGDCVVTIFEEPDDLRWKRVPCNNKHSFVCIKTNSDASEVTSGGQDTPTGKITDQNWFKFTVLGGSIVIGFILGCVIGRSTSRYKRNKNSSSRAETSPPKDPDQDDEKLGEEEDTYAEIDEVRRRSIRMSLRHPQAAMHEDRKSDADSSSTPAINVNKYQISQPVDSTKDSGDEDSNYETADMVNANIQQETFPASPAAKGVMIVNPRTPLAYLERDVDY